MHLLRDLPLPPALCAFVLFGAVTAHAQTESAMTATPRQPLVAQAPGAVLMNSLQERMKRIQAIPDPALRQKRMDEFFITLQRNMADISKQGAPVSGR